MSYDTSCHSAFGQRGGYDRGVYTVKVRGRLLKIKDGGVWFRGKRVAQFPYKPSNQHLICLAAALPYNNKIKGKQRNHR